jgi:membrane associated rhomboid family serine protease
MRQHHSPFALTPWVRGLLFANAAVFFLQITVFTGPWFVETFGFSPGRILEQWWTPLTYMFVHGGFLHLAFNMLVLFVFGPRVEDRMGGREFIAYYVVCGLGGAALSFGLMLTTPAVSVIGASGAVLGVALAYAMFWPNQEIYVFPLPMPVKVKWLVAFIAGQEVLAAAFSPGSNVAHLAHLGGLLFGFVFLRIEGSVRRRAHEVFTRPRVPHVVPPRARKARERVTSPEPPADRTPYDEVDRVLDKISESGLDSLTPDEQRLLDEVSRRLRSN